MRSIRHVNYYKLKFVAFTKLLDDVLHSPPSLKAERSASNFVNMTATFNETDVIIGILL